MKCFRVMNLSDNGLPATNLHFLDRNDAQRYQKMLLWPFEKLGYMPVSPVGRIKIGDVQFRVESTLLPGIYDADLDWVLWRKDGILGFTPVVPGRCFDPVDWRPISEHDLKDPMIMPKIAHAERELDSN